MTITQIDLTDLSVDELLSLLADARLRCADIWHRTPADYEERKAIVEELQERGLGPTMSMEEAREKAVELGLR